MEMLEQVWAWIQAHPDMVLNGVGGAVLGPILAKIVRGGMGTGFLGGLLGGIGAGFGADMTNLNDIVATNVPMIEDGDILSYLQNLAEGAAGGGVLGGIVGGIFGRRR